MEVCVVAQRVELPRRGVSRLRNRIGRVFSRVAAGVTRLNVTLRDTHGGRNKVCVLRAELADGGEVLVMDRSSKLRRALFRCLRRGRRLVRREIRRRRSRQRGRRRLSPAPHPAA